MKTSVVIPAYNAEKYLAATIASVQRQTDRDWEIVVINDGSRDSTGAIAEELAAADPRIRVCHQSNSGVAAARNYGIAESDPSAEYFLFLDADDVLEDNALEVLVGALEADKTALAVHGLSRFIDGSGRVHQEGAAEEYGRSRKGVSGNRLIDYPAQTATCFPMLVYRNVILTPGQVLVRKTTLDTVGLFDKAVSPAEDWEMWLRITQLGEMAFADTVVLNYRRHDLNASSQNKVMREAEMALRRKLFKNKDLTPEQRRTAAAGYRHSQRFFYERWLKMAKERFSAGHTIEGAKLLPRAGMYYIQSVIGFAR